MFLSFKFDVCTKILRIYTALVWSWESWPGFRRCILGTCVVSHAFFHLRHNKSRYSYPSIQVSTRPPFPHRSCSCNLYFHWLAKPRGEDDMFKLNVIWEGCSLGHYLQDMAICTIPFSGDSRTIFPFGVRWAAKKPYAKNLPPGAWAFPMEKR